MRPPSSIFGSAPVPARGLKPQASSLKPQASGQSSNFCSRLTTRELARSSNSE
jgi:hypothetical protein